MNPMYAAIKNRRGGLMGGDHEASHQSEHAVDKDVDQGKDLHGFVASLSDSDKVKLKSMLNGKSNGIEKGEASPEEKGKIAQRAQEEDMMHGLEAQAAPHDEDGEGGVDSDAIASSMVDHKAKSAIESGVKPRNLGERMKMGLAQKLKAKGKL